MRLSAPCRAGGGFALVAAEDREQPQELEVDPHEGDEQAERHAPRLALRGAERQLVTIGALVQRIGRSLPVRVLPTLYRDSSQLSHDILGAIGRRFERHLAPAPVREHEVLREAASFGQAVTGFAPGSAAHDDFRRLAEWVATVAVPALEPSAAPDAGVSAPSVYGSGTLGVPEGDLDGDGLPRPAVTGRAAELAHRMRTTGVGAPPREAGSLEER